MLGDNNSDSLVELASFKLLHLFQIEQLMTLESLDEQMPEITRNVVRYAQQEAGSTMDKSTVTKSIFTPFQKMAAPVDTKRPHMHTMNDMEPKVNLSIKSPKTKVTVLKEKTTTDSAPNTNSEASSKSDKQQRPNQDVTGQQQADEPEASKNITEIVSQRCNAHKNRSNILEMNPFLRQRQSKLAQQRKLYPSSEFYCEVGMKSLLRSLSKFFKDRIRLENGHKMQVITLDDAR